MHGEHEGGVEDGAVGADEAGELAVGEPPERIGRGRGWGRCRGGEHEVVEAALPLPRVARPAVAAEHAHLGVRVAAAAAAAAVAAADIASGLHPPCRSSEFSSQISPADPFSNPSA